MKATDLRIGNWVSSAGNESTVESIKNTYMFGHMVGLVGNAVYNRIETIKPIPLTEEWAERLGLGQRNKGSGVYSLIMNKRNVTHSVYLTIGFIDGKAYSEFYIGKSPNNKLLLDIKYVHELQNFCHTFGEELTIK